MSLVARLASHVGAAHVEHSALYSHFITPWADNNLAAALHVEPDFHLPSCYNVQPPPPAASKVANFTDETLFYIFYSAPRDLLQEVAAQELCVTPGGAYSNFR